MHANILPKLLDIYIEFPFQKVEGDSADLVLNLKEKLLKSRSFSTVAMEFAFYDTIYGATPISETSVNEEINSSSNLIFLRTLN